MILELPQTIHDDSGRGARDRAFLARIAEITRCITIRLQRNHLTGDALADAVAETMAICWASYASSKRTVHSAIGHAVAETRSRLRAIRKAQYELACELWPETMTDRIAWEYPDGEIAVEEAKFPRVPIETPETRKRSFVHSTDFDNAKRFPLLATRTMGDMEAAEEIDAADARCRIASDAAWIGCRQSALLDAIERSLNADADAI